MKSFVAGICISEKFTLFLFCRTVLFTGKNTLISRNLMF